MKKVYTLTFCDTPNYGALLQAYALKKYLQISGYNCSIINYQNPKRKYSQVSGLRKIRSIIWNNTFAKLFNSKKRANLTSEFRNKYLSLSTVYSSPNELKSLNQDSDCFIVGSDQVWNPQNNGYDNAYLLSFVDEFKKRISYAASLGSANETYLISNSELFKRFDALSVREKESAVLFKDKLGLSASTVIDPVFLLNKTDWINCLHLPDSSANIQDSGYVLCYVMPGNDELTNKIYNVAKAIADEKSLKIITLGKKNYAKPIGIEILDGDAGPVEFMQYIQNASYVVTNSFHGTALSVVFRKQFYTVLKNGIKRNSRMEDLLKMLSLSDRIIYTDQDLKKNVTSEIDYERSVRELNKQIEYAKQFLIQAIEE